MARRMPKRATWWRNDWDFLDKSLLNKKYLAIKSLTKDSTIFRDVMGTVGDICVLYKYPPKREKMLGSIVENIEGEFEESSRSDNQKLNKLWVTKWTIKGKCFKKILDNYKALLKL